MKDYPLFKMFVEKISDIHKERFMDSSSKIIVSSFNVQKTEEENVNNLRNLFHCEICQYPCLIYGDDFGAAVFSIQPNLLPKMKKYCQQAANDYNQLGYIEWNSEKEQAYFVNVNEVKRSRLLSPWNNTIERLEEWMDNIHSSFKFEGIWNRGMSYVQYAAAQYNESKNEN